MDMSQDIRDFVPPSCELLGLGEPTHAEPAFAQVRNELVVQLVERGFRSIAIETDRVAALTVDGFFQTREGARDANKQLIAWINDYNSGRPEEDRVVFHGFDTSTDNYSAPSPRTYLEHARDFMGLDVDIATIAGEDEQWSRTEAILDPAESIGDTAQAEKLRVIADDLLTELYMRAPAAPSRAGWNAAKTHLTAGINLLRYHKKAAQRINEQVRLTSLIATRDALMAENLLDIRRIEANRGPTLVFAHNLHLKRSPSTMQIAGMETTFNSVGRIIASLVDGYTVIVGSLGHSEEIGLPQPEPDTFEGKLQQSVDTWALMKASEVAPGEVRTDTNPRQGYFPLEQATLEGADAVLHIS
jgi:erythromycin esterase-like protein